VTTLSFLPRRSLKPVSIAVSDDAVIEIGRCRGGEVHGMTTHPDGVRVALDVPSLSDRHARLHVRGGRLYVEDLHSRNGTLLRVEPGVTRPLEGAMLWLGPDLTVRVDEAGWELPDAPRDMTTETLLTWLGARLKAKGLVAELVPSSDDALRLEGQAMRLAVRPSEQLGTVDAEAQGWVQAVISIWNAAQHRPSPSASWRFVAASPARRRVRAQCERIVRASLPVLLVGRADSGRRVLAQDLHDHGPHPEGPFVTFRVASVARERIEAALFGADLEGVHRLGLIDQAAGGTLYLDDVALLPASAQVRLLQSLSDGALRDARLIAATSRELRGRAEGFREDLYWRLASLRVDVPPPGPEDLVVIARQVIERACSNAGVALDASIGDDLAARASSYAWRDGSREMCEALERLVRVKLPDVGWRESWDAMLATHRHEATPATLPQQLQIAPAALGRMLADLLFLRAAEETPQRAVLARRLQMTYQGADARAVALDVELDDRARVTEARKELEATFRRTLAETPGLREVLRALTDP
jgi:DNA-binding NtrC family response regulator